VRSRPAAAGSRPRTRTRYNADAREDIRYLDRDQANALDLPAHDFWIFKGTRLVLMYFTADGRHVGSELITDRRWSRGTSTGSTWR